jgi:meso-butanediol dehydrogenase / (S,S)-butanediol dehydrogenase / diacetyl reductase
MMPGHDDREEPTMTDARPSRDDGRLAGRLALVTGGGHGIGAATAARLAADGATVAIADLDPETATAMARTIEDRGGRAAAFTADVSDAGAVGALVDEVQTALGPIDILDNNAGRLVPGTALSQEIEEWDRTLTVNVRSVFLMCRAVLPGFCERGQGVIVNTGSISGLVGEPDLVAYNTSKAAIINLTRQLAADFSPRGGRVNCVCPGWIRTGFNDPLFVGWSEEAIQELVERQVPLGRQGTAEDVADAVAFLCCDDARYITGHALVVDGGLTATNL